MVIWSADSEKLSIPAGITDIQAFRRWTDSDDFPEKGYVWWLQGEVWVDMSREQIFTHVLVKTEFAAVLSPLAKRGIFLTGGVLLSNFEADISGNPDSVFLSNAALRSGRIRLIEGKEGGYVEVQGSPDMVLEVVSASSEEKDFVVLKQGYWEAGLREYWLVDTRADPLRFDIFRHTARGYVATRKQKGWLKSAVFGKSFRLSQRLSALKHPDYTLAVR